MREVVGKRLEYLLFTLPSPKQLANRFLFVQRWYHDGHVFQDLTPNAQYLCPLSRLAEVLLRRFLIDLPGEKTGQNVCIFVDGETKEVR